MKNTPCPYCSKKSNTSDAAQATNQVVLFGRFKHRGSRKIVQRYRCKRCLKTFSNATGTFEFGQKKRRVNKLLFQLLASCVSMRRSAIIMKIDQKTVARRLHYFAKVAEAERYELLATRPKSIALQFDDMESFEHTKLKPLSIPLVVDAKTREVLSYDVAQMPAKGTTAAISRKKYGYRKDLRTPAWLHVLGEATKACINEVVITSDSHKRYPEVIRKTMPNAIHIQTKSRRACVVGQGELKRGGHDPLFSLNHTAAMKRANVNRLARKTWCTTKRPDRLKAHIALYVLWHNEVIAAQQEKRDLRFPF